MWLTLNPQHLETSLTGKIRPQNIRRPVPNLHVTSSQVKKPQTERHLYSTLYLILTKGLYNQWGKRVTKTQKLAPSPQDLDTRTPVAHTLQWTYRQWGWGNPTGGIWNSNPQQVAAVRLSLVTKDSVSIVGFTTWIESFLGPMVY